MLNSFRKNVLGIYGKQGEKWLFDLPNIVEHYQDMWGLTNLIPVENLSYNYVLRGNQGPTAIILKIGLDKSGLEKEAAALNMLSGYGAVTVLKEKDGALLLERLIPGTSLKEIFPQNEKLGLEIGIKTIQRLHQAPLPVQHSFPLLRDWLGMLDKDFPIPRLYLEKASALRDHLLATSSEPVLLHGDLHHENILQQGTEWVFIDPKGIIGDPLYEAGAFIRNPISSLLTVPESEKIIDRRIEAFGNAFGWEKKRLIEWCFVQAVIAWIWALEDNGESNLFKDLTDIFEKKI